MIDSLIVKDDVLPMQLLETIRASAIQSGFGTWRPNKGEIGSSIYDGMSFWGLHSFLLKALHRVLGTPAYPNNMFFRVTTPDTEKAYCHSDREWGDWTCIFYLSHHKEVSGTGFYRHRETGLLEMPPLEELCEPPAKDKYGNLKEDMVTGGEEQWEEMDFVRGNLNRMLIFHAPLFHSRYPKHGIGSTPDDARMVWVSHFDIK